MILALLTAAAMETVSVMSSSVVVGPGILHGPEALARSPHGGFWVGDRGVARFHFFSMDGRHVRSFGGNGQGWMEFSDRVAVTDPGGQFVYLADTDGSRMLKVDRAGVPVTEIRGPGGGVWPWKPLAVASLPDGRVFVADEGSGTIMVTDPFDGLRRLSGAGDEPRIPLIPAGLACAAGRVAVSDQAGGLVHFFDTHGNHRGAIAVGGSPGSVDIRKDGLGAMVDEEAHVVRVFKNGVVYDLSCPPAGMPQLASPSAVCFATDGMLLVAERESDTIVGLALAEVP
ncbi:hypothetical protein JXA88_07005 [Candidatus Fermentibacteria bacterium]|nr:hypothetical protein [Candidatus Fermentibacteria bacterium]